MEDMSTAVYPKMTVYFAALQIRLRIGEMFKLNVDDTF